jgi:hypothetical protein
MRSWANAFVTKKLCMEVCFSGNEIHPMTFNSLFHNAPREAQAPSVFNDQQPTTTKPPAASFLAQLTEWLNAWRQCQAFNAYVTDLAARQSWLAKTDTKMIMCAIIMNMESDEKHREADFDLEMCLGSPYTEALLQACKTLVEAKPIPFQKRHKKSIEDGKVQASVTHEDL